ncbi:hypothetical protein ACQKFX_27120, partial [Cupriavidus metallidurans]|uniref:hypothetical protein n=1 Tax=Cupriavidus metallidurans TaxID=119219 RepID=UPI003D08CDF2
MIDQSKALPKVGMSELRFSVIADTWPHSKARYRISGLMVSDQYRMRLPQNLGQIHDEENNLDVLVFCAGIERLPECWPPDPESRERQSSLALPARDALGFQRP